MSNELRLTLIQQDIAWEDKQANLAATERQLAEVEDTDLIILPEMFTTGFSMKPEHLAEEEDGETLHFMQKMAANKQAAVTGSLIAKENGHYYNRLLWVYPDGSYHAYDKRHLFRMSEENKHYTAGNARLIVHYKGWRILPLICYDLRFPVWSRNDAGYDLLLYIANWPQSRSQVWETLLLARALENQVYVAGVNRIGEDGRGTHFSGNSMLIDAKGNKLSTVPAGKPFRQTITISLGKLNHFRNKFPVDKDRDAFALLHANTFYAHDNE